MAERTDHFYQQLADFYHCGPPTILTVNKDIPSEKLAGVAVSINDIPLSQPVFDGKFFSGSEVILHAEGGSQPVKGWQMVQVNDDGSQSERMVDGEQYAFTMPSCRSLMVNAVFETSGIHTILASDKQDDTWYTIDGRRLNGRPQQSGLYINAGRKVVVK